MLSSLINTYDRSFKYSLYHVYINTVLLVVSSLISLYQQNVDQPHPLNGEAVG